MPTRTQKVVDTSRRVVLKDSTMREGLDVPGVALGIDQKRALLELLDQAGVPEVEIVAPGHFDRDLDALKAMGAPGQRLQLSGLIYGNGPRLVEQLKKAKGVLDRVDILIPLSDLRPPAGRDEKARRMRQALQEAGDTFGRASVGFPHATQVERDLVLEMCGQAVLAGAARITLYDTNGGSEPFTVAALVEQIRGIVQNAEICFHAHNDLGMATANSVAAVMAGAECLDVTVNGLGDRAGNASLEQVALALYSLGVATGLKLDLLRGLSQAVEAMTLIPVSKLAPVVGEFVFCHKSPSHLETPTLFEAFDPALVGARRSVCKS